MLNGESRPSWKPTVRSHSSRTPPSGSTGSHSSTVSAPNARAKAIASRARRRSYAAHRGASARGANLAAAASASAAPRARGDEIARKARVTSSATRESFAFEFSTNVVYG